MSSGSRRALPFLSVKENTESTSSIVFQIKKERSKRRYNSFKESKSEISNNLTIKSNSSSESHYTNKKKISSQNISLVSHVNNLNHANSPKKSSPKSQYKGYIKKEDTVISQHKINQFNKLHKPKKSQSFFESIRLNDSIDDQNTKKIDDELLEDIEIEELLGSIKISDEENITHTIHPESSFKILWDLVAIMFIMYHAIVTPYRICFNDLAYGDLAIFENVIDLFFIIDFVIAFNTGYYEFGNLIMERKLIIQRYMNFWMWIDFIACFPFLLIVDPSLYFNTEKKTDKTNERVS